MAQKISADTPAIVQALMEQLARSNAENSTLQCKLAAERMISSQIFAAMEVIVPSSHEAVLKVLQNIALELEHKAGGLTDLTLPLTENSSTTLGLHIIAAHIRQFSATYHRRSCSNSNLRLVVDNSEA